MNLDLLLTQISNINKKYEEICKFSGERFNIFNILNLSADEKSHSRMIASLLDPKGMHGKDTRFLGLFLECIEVNDFSLEGVSTEIEKFIGYIPEDYNSGGKIDITVTNMQKKQIVIENKIYADDQWNQLLRYYEYNPHAHLIYLTLFGTDPGDKSIGKGKKINYKKISYKDHILKWLELCKLDSSDNPLLRETLTQYIILIKQITGQARSTEMQEEYLNTILKDADNVSAAFIISQNLNEIKLQILKDKFVPLMSRLGKKHGFTFEISFDGCFDSWWGFSFIKPEWEKYKIDFEFEGRNMQNLIYGFYDVGISHGADKYLRSLNYKSSENWPLYQVMDHYRNWNSEFFMELYSNEKNIFNVFESKIEELSSIVETLIMKYQSKSTSSGKR